MFIAQAFHVKHEFWRYIIGSVIVASAAMLGQLPMLGVILISLGWEGMQNTPQDEVMHVLDPNTNLFLMLFSFAIALIAMMVVIRLFHQQDIRTVTTTRPKVDWGRVVFVFSLMALFSIGSTLLDYHFHPGDYRWNFEWKKFIILALIAIPMIPLQSSLEEYLFRGYLMQGFGVLAKNKWFPLLMTSLIFGGLHYFNPEVGHLGPIVMIFYIGTGLFLGIITLMDEGMELALGFHAANNLIGVLLVTGDWTALQTNSVFKSIVPPSSGIEVITPVFIVYPILLFILAKKYKWTGWQDKLLGTVLFKQVPLRKIGPE